MIVCRIDIANGATAGAEDALALAQRFGRCADVALFDSDAAANRGSNRALIEAICARVRTRVLLGESDAHLAKTYLEAGARSIVFSGAALLEPRTLPRERTMIACDSGTDGLEDVLRKAALAGGVVLTQGRSSDDVRSLAQSVRETTGLAVTVAGAASAIDDIIALDGCGIDAEIDVERSCSEVDPFEIFVRTIAFEKNGGLVPTIVCDAEGGRPRMLAYSSAQSLRAALNEGAGWYWSRSRKRLWKKGESSGNVQELIRVERDCDRDALLFYVRQNGPTCHTGGDRCFGGSDWAWEDLTARIALRATPGGERSYTRKLLHSKELLDAKLREEADETARAITPAEVAWECADLLFFMSVKMQSAGVSIGQVMSQLASRAGGA